MVTALVEQLERHVCVKEAREVSSNQKTTRSVGGDSIEMLNVVLNGG